MDKLENGTNGKRLIENLTIENFGNWGNWKIEKWKTKIT